jgi:hypothetical protein
MSSERHVRASRLFAASEQHRIASLQRESGSVDRHVGTRFVDHRDHTERDALPAHEEAVRTPHHLRDLPNGIVERRNRGDGVSDTAEPVRIERQTIDHRRVEPSRACTRDVFGVRGEHSFSGAIGLRTERSRESEERGVFFCPGRARHPSRGGSRFVCEDNELHAFHALFPSRPTAPRELL